MPDRTRFANLLSPITIGRQEIRNRVLVTAHEIKMSSGNLPTDSYIAYQAARARGGVGLQVTGSSGFHHTGRLPTGSALDNLDETIVPAFRKLAHAVHREGGRMLTQLGHGAATFMSREPGSPSWAPSATPGDLSQHVPHEMTQSEIAEIIDAYAAAAARARRGELAGVELLAAFGFLPIAFVSPLTNQRTDEYGGSFDNRMRFLLEAAEAIRGALGDDCIFGVRMPGDEQLVGGLDNEALRDVARRLERSARVDYLNVIAGTNQSRVLRAEHWPPTPARHGLFVELARSIKESVGLPVFTAGRVTDPLQAEDIIRSGAADMVGMTRAHIADPELVRKLSEGRYDDVRRCVGANVCIRNTYEGRPVSCIYNPETSREAEWGDVKPATTPRRVVVVGGGPAGLEAARVCALRGHQVELFERFDELGGQVRLWSKVPSMRELGGAIQWYADQLSKLQVKITLNQSFDVDTAERLRPDEIVLAAGSFAWRPGIPGEADSNMAVSTPSEVLEAIPERAVHTVVWDRLGGGAALYAADALADAGFPVSIVTAHDAVGESLTVTLRVPLYKRLLAKDARFHPLSEVRRIEGSEVVIENVYSGSETRLEAVGLLIAWHGNRTENDLGEALRSQGHNVHVIGDNLAPREMDVAVAEGASVARAL